MSIKKNLVISITDYSDELNGIKDTVGLDIRTIDGALSFEPKANKVIVLEKDIEEALEAIKEFRTQQPNTTTIVTNVTPLMQVSFEEVNDNI